MKPNYYTIHKNKKPKKLPERKVDTYLQNLIEEAKNQIIRVPDKKFTLEFSTGITHTKNGFKQRMLHKFRTTGRYVK